MVSRNRQPLATSQPAAWFTVVAAIALCGTIAWVLLAQRAVLTRSLASLERFRQARVEIANGMLHHALAGGPGMPYDRAQGLALLQQGIAEVQEVVEQLRARGMTGDHHDDSVRTFRSHADAFLATLAAADHDQSHDTRVRLAFHELERAIDQLDQQRRADLRTRVESLDRSLAVTSSAAIAMLVVICAAAVIASRTQTRTVAALRAGEDRLRTVLDNLAEGVAITDADGRVRQWNRAADELFELSALGSDIDSATLQARFELLDAAGRSLPAEQWPIARLRQGAAVRGEEFVLRRRSDGATRLLLCNGALAADSSGTPVCSLTFSDLSERWRAETALRAEKDRLDRIAHTSPGVVHALRLCVDGTVAFSYVSSRVRDLLGLEVAVLMRDGRPLFDGMAQPDRDAAWQAIEHSRRELTPLRYEFRFQHPTRGEIWIEDHAMPTLESDGDVTWHGVMIEVTERKRVEAVVRAQDRLLQEMGHIAKVGGWEFDPATGQGQWTAEVARIHDLDPEFPPSRELGLRFYPGPARERLAAAIAAAVDDGTPYDLELPFLSACAVRKWVRTIGRAVKVNGRVERVRGAFMDITDRKEAENLARLQHAITKILAECTTHSEMATRLLESLCTAQGFCFGEFLAVDRAGRALHSVCAHVARAPGGPIQLPAPGRELAERAWSQSCMVWLSDIAQDPSHPSFRTMHAADVQAALAFPVTLRHNVVGVLRFLHREPLQHDPQLAATFTAIGTQVGNFIERLHLEGQFRQTQKMEALGTLAGGIAHDFNNILTAILGNVALAQMEVGDRPTVCASLEAVMAASQRATALVRQILLFSRPQESQRQVLDLRQVVEDASRLLRASIPTTIEFELSLAADTPRVHADPSQVHQVVMNLCANSAHAMRGGPGKLEFTLSGCEVDEALAATPAGLRPGRYARLTIRDTGHGMDAATLERIFEPFFTTKPPGEGTGLGLAVVHGIMQAHQGVVTVCSQPGEGTRCDLYFPAVPAERTLEPQERTPGAAVAGSGERIMFIDDEEAITAVGKRALEALGFEVDAVVGAERGWEAFAAAADRFALVITDLTMPGMTGLELARRIHDLRPELPVILTSGYPATLSPERAREAGVRMVLQKPLSLSKLGESVQQVLRDTPGAVSGVARDTTLSA